MQPTAHRGKEEGKHVSPETCINHSDENNLYSPGYWKSFWVSEGRKCIEHLTKSNKMAFTIHTHFLILRFIPAAPLFVLKVLVPAFSMFCKGFVPNVHLENRIDRVENKSINKLTYFQFLKIQAYKSQTFNHISISLYTIYQLMLMYKFFLY